MQCIRPLTAWQSPEGPVKFTPKGSIPGLLPFSLPCGRCLACHLNRAREKGIRAWHEAKYHQDSMFLTLTYSDEHLPGPTLVKEDSQKFIKRLRKSLNHPIGVVTTGEYGTQTKRPHWHYLIFGFRPGDLKPARETDFGPTYTSSRIDSLWGGRGRHEIGAVTLESASYVARYGAKALGEHDPAYKPYHHTGSKRALGKLWIQDNAEHTFSNGFIVLPNGSPGKIPRYYVDWAKEHRNDLWRHYVTQVRPSLESKAEERQRKDELYFVSQVMNYSGGKGMYPLNRRQVQYIILKEKFKRLTEEKGL